TEPRRKVSTEHGARRIGTTGVAVPIGAAARNGSANPSHPSSLAVLSSLCPQSLCGWFSPPDGAAMTTAEHQRLSEIRNDHSGWRRWGPYLSDRAWATVREDYSADGNAWAYFPHDHARSRAYRWGEDGIAGVCDRYQLLCFAPAFWNGKD